MMQLGRQRTQANLTRLFIELSLTLFLIHGSVSHLLGAESGASDPGNGSSYKGVTPPSVVQSAIEEKDQAFLKAALAQDTAVMGALLAADFVYVHENGFINTKAQFLTDFVAKGYTVAVLTPKEPMRQYGSTVFTISTGHLQLKTETPYPPTTVTHIWVEQGGKWLLAHRHESHKGEPIGKQLSQRGGPNLTGELGSKPSPALAKLINEREAAWVYSMMTTDVPRMDELVDDSLRYIHVTGHTSDKKAFMKELVGGYTETYFLDASMRQFGDTVLVLHRAQYRHTGGPEQSPGVAMHAWVKKGERWVLVGRQSTRFESY